MDLTKGMHTKMRSREHKINLAIQKKLIKRENHISVTNAHEFTYFYVQKIDVHKNRAKSMPYFILKPQETELHC